MAPDQPLRLSTATELERELEARVQRDQLPTGMGQPIPCRARTARVDYDSTEHPVRTITLTVDTDADHRTAVAALAIALSMMDATLGGDRATALNP